MLQQNIWELQGSSLNRHIRRAQAVKHMLKDSKIRLILDVGCAEGFVTSFISNQQTFAVGVDIDESIKTAKTKVKNARQ